MPYISFEGNKFRGNMNVRLALKSRFPGLGNLGSLRICAKLGFYPRMKMHQLSEGDFLALSKELLNYTTGDALRQVVRENIAAKRSIGTYAGRRHALGYPVRGQRTKKNGQTAKRLNKVSYMTVRRFSTQSTSRVQLFLEQQARERETMQSMKSIVQFVTSTVGKLKFW
ncbi:mitochondrial 37S ribosomal protein uS13m [Lipomyces oligophaga]|uniref:mitochondrial 37S ribosomal protein uS13m n=1 Tax=Lipomyces oligophaga TaxID=45792 RepID=UPI0034CF66EB